MSIDKCKPSKLIIHPLKRGNSIFIYQEFSNFVPLEGAGGGLFIVLNAKKLFK